MIKKMILILAASVCLFCQNKENRDELLESLLDVDSEFSKYSTLHGADEAFYRYMDEEGIVLPRQGNPVQGREIFRKLFEQKPANGRTSLLEWIPEWAEVSRSGDLGYTFGRYTQTSTEANGSAESSGGFYVTIWKRQADGSWRFVFDTGNVIPSTLK